MKKGLFGVLAGVLAIFGKKKASKIAKEEPYVFGGIVGERPTGRFNLSRLPPRWKRRKMMRIRRDSK